jgi:hypothetical protein
VPIVAVFILSLGYSMILYFILGALDAQIPVADPVAALFPGAVYDAILGAAIGPLVVTIHDRRAAEERVDW